MGGFVWSLDECCVVGWFDECGFGARLLDFEVFVPWMMDLNCGKLRLLWVSW